MTAKQTYYVRTDGKGEPGETRNWDQEDPDSDVSEECVNRPWNAMSFIVDGRRFTALYLDHPSNPKPAALQRTGLRAIWLVFCGGRD